MEGRQTLTDPDFSPEAEIDRLYSSPLAEFISVRKDIVTRLRGDGQDATADLVSNLKKPTVSAWVVNQLAHTNELDIQRLLKAGEILEQTQRDLLSGKSNDFESARREEASAVRLLHTAAKGLLPGASAPILDRITRTLRSATSSEARAQIKAGRLIEDLEPPGFEAFTAGSPAQTKNDKSGKDKGPNRSIALAEQKRVANKTAMELASTALEFERVAKESELVATKARQKAEVARKRADDAAETVQRIAAELGSLKKN